MWGRHRQCGEGTDNIGRAQTTWGWSRDGQCRSSQTCEGGLVKQNKKCWATYFWDPNNACHCLGPLLAFVHRDEAVSWALLLVWKEC